jgi:hypothetical protein
MSFDTNSCYNWACYYHVCRAMSQAVSRWNLTAEALVRTESVPLGFVADKVALGEVPIRVLRFVPVNMFPPWFSILIYHLVDDRQAH